MIDVTWHTRLKDDNRELHQVLFTVETTDTEYYSSILLSTLSDLKANIEERRKNRERL